MKRYTLILAAAMLCLSACGETDDSNSKAKKITKAPAEAVSESIEEESASANESTAETEAKSEEYPESYELTFNDTKTSVISKATLLVTGPTGESSLEDMLDKDVMASGTVGLVGAPVAIDLEGEKGTVTFTVDKDALGDVPFENLIILKSGQGMSFDQVNCTYDNENISFEITESDTYMLVDAYQWLSAWGADVTGMEHDTEFKVGDFGFTLTMPEGVAPNGVMDYWHADYNGEHQMMSKQLMHQNQSKDADVKAELYAWRYPNEEDDCDDPTPFMSFDDKIKEISSLTSDYFTIETADIWALDGGRKGFVTVFHFPADPDKGLDEQTNINAYYEYADDTYISYNLSFYGHDQSKIDQCVKSAKSFTYFE